MIRPESAVTHYWQGQTRHCGGPTANAAVHSTAKAAGELVNRANFDVDEIGVGLIGTLQPKNAETVVGDGEGHVRAD